MSFIFQNINMLAGFPIDNVHPAGTSEIDNPKPVDNAFQAFLAMALGLQAQTDSVCSQIESLSIIAPSLPDFNSPILMPLDETIPSKADTIETKEQIAINSDIIRIILSNCSDTINIILPNSVELTCVQPLNSRPNPGSVNAAPVELSTEPIHSAECRIPNFAIPSKSKPPLSPGEIGKQVTPIKLSQSNYSKIAKQIVASEPSIIAPTINGDTIISFRIGDLFKSQATDYKIPIQIMENAQQPWLESVGINRLKNLISEYPEPITIEIENFDRTIFTPPIEENQTPINYSTQKTTINFSFDMRDIVKEETVQLFESKAVKGILSSIKPYRQSENISPHTSVSVRQPAIAVGIRPVFTKMQMRNLTRGIASYQPQEPKMNRDNKNYNISGNDDEIPVSASPAPEEPIRANMAFANSELPIQEIDLKSKPRIRQKANLNSQTSVNGKFELAVAPDQFGPKKIRIQQLLFDLRENENIQQVKFDEIKAVLLKAIDRNIKTLKLRLEPKGLGSLDIKLCLGDDGISILLKADNQEATNILGTRLADLKSGLEIANVKIIELHVVSDKAAQTGGNDINSRGFAGGFGRQDKSADQHAPEGKSKRFADAIDGDAEMHDFRIENNKNGWINLKA